MNVKDLIEEARESGDRELADTMDLMLSAESPLDVPPTEHPLPPKRGLYFRSGIILATEYENRGTDDERPEAREVFVKSLRNAEERRLADAFEYCWSNPEEVKSEDFDPDVLPVQGPELTTFLVGFAFGLAHE